MIDYNEQLIGFLVRDGGIGLGEWRALIENDARFVKKPPSRGVNPFTGKPHDYRNTSYEIVLDGDVVGLACWEQAESVGLAGRRDALKSMIVDYCGKMSATFEDVDGNQERDDPPAGPANR